MKEDDIIAALRRILGKEGPIREVRMFGGTGFMLAGNFVAGTFKQGLLLRVGKDGLAKALKIPGARQAKMGERLMAGYAHIPPAKLSEMGIGAALSMAIAFASTLPKKAAVARKARKK